MIYLISYVYIYIYIGKTKYPAEIKGLLYANVFQFYVHAFGSAILSSASGLIGFMVLGILLCRDA